MEHLKTLSALLRDAETLEAATIALLREYPDLSVGTILAAEQAEIIEVGWAPSSRHRDSAYLVSMAEFLRPIGEKHGDILIREAFEIFAKSDHAHANEIARALEAT
jgi:hypothetical protein